MPFPRLGGRTTPRLDLHTYALWSDHTLFSQRQSTNKFTMNRRHVLLKYTPCVSFFGVCSDWDSCCLYEGRCAFVFVVVFFFFLNLGYLEIVRKSTCLRFRRFLLLLLLLLLLFRALFIWSLYKGRCAFVFVFLKLGYLELVRM